MDAHLVGDVAQGLHPLLVWFLVRHGCLLAVLGVKQAHVSILAGFAHAEGKAILTLNQSFCRRTSVLCWAKARAEKGRQEVGPCGSGTTELAAACAKFAIRPAKCIRPGEWALFRVDCTALPRTRNVQ